MIKVSDVLRAQPNCLWSITNYGSAGKRQANKYPLFHQEIKIQKVSYTVANPRQGVQLPSRTSAGEMTAGWPWGIHGGKNLAGLPEQKCLEEKRSTRTSHLIQPSGKERGRRTGRWWAGRGARSHRRWAWCHLRLKVSCHTAPPCHPLYPAKASRSFPGQHKVCPGGLTSCLGWDDGKSIISWAGGRDRCPTAGCGAPTARPLKVPAPSQPTEGILTKSTTHGVHSCGVVTVCPQCPFSDVCRGCTHPESKKSPNFFKLPKST